jgi:hypothetical protein
MSMLVPDRWIFLVKAAGHTFSLWTGTGLRFKSNIPRKIKSALGALIENERD